MIRDPDALRVFWLFGKSYCWARSRGGRLMLVPIIVPAGRPETNLADLLTAMCAGPLPWPSEGNPDA